MRHPSRTVADLRAVPLRLRQRRQREDEAKQLCETYAVPTSGKPLFQAAAANLNPWTEAKVDTDNPQRGTAAVISGEKDHTVPWAIAHASYKQQEDNDGVTEIVEIKNRGHALTIDSGWREVDTTPQPSSSASSPTDQIRAGMGDDVAQLAESIRGCSYRPIPIEHRWC